MKKIIGKGKGESGQGMVEFAMVFPLFLFLIFAIIDFSWYLNHKWALDYETAACADSITSDTSNPNEVAKNIILGDIRFLENSRLSASVAITKSNTNTPKYIPLGGGKGIAMQEKRNYDQIDVTAEYRYKYITPVGYLISGDGTAVIKSSSSVKRYWSVQEIP